ncbi:unnamed protein product [Rhizoctonia solani]|uniref:Uncharacterized protein n=1 Tax=Rhizoctonia solani TaxID=456999 RepID=A0A8H2WDU0_9AGAM|nr:unnamed protein product [Rhizoctonia solani]
MIRWLLAMSYLFALALAFTNHGAQAEHRELKRGGPSPENAVVFDQKTSSTATRTARLRTTLPVFELTCGRTSEYELGRALEENMLVRGRPLSKVIYKVEPDLALFNWMRFDQTRRILTGTPPVAQPPPIPLGSPSYLDIYIYIGADRSYRLRTALGLIIRDSSDTTEANSTPISASIPADEQVPRPRGVVLGVLIAVCVLLALLALGGLGWMISMREYFKHGGHHGTNPQSQSPTKSHQSNSRSLPSTSNRATSITSTRRRVRTADHGAESPSKSALQLSSGETGTKNSAPPSTRKRATTLLQTIHTRAIGGSPKIGFGNSGGSKASLDSSSTTARKAFPPRLGLSQFSPRLGLGQLSPSFTIEESPKKENGSLVVEKSPVYTNSWSSALRLDPFRSPGGEADSVAGVEQERPVSPTPNKALRICGNKTMSVSELFLPDSSVNNSGPCATVDGSGLSSDHYDHAGNIGFIDHASNRSGSSTQATPHAPVALNRAESYVERTNQLGMALLTSPANIHMKSANGALGITFDSFFSPVTQRPSPEPRYGEVSSERMVKVGHSQETLTTAYVTASESGVSPGAQNRYNSPIPGQGIPEHVGAVGSPITLHSQTAELDNVATPSFIVHPDTTTIVREETSDRLLSGENPSSPPRVEYGRGDRSLRALYSFPAMLRGSLSCFPEDVSLNTPMFSTPFLPSTGASRSDSTHREASDIMLLPADDLTQGCLVLTRIGEDSTNHHEIANTSGNTGALLSDVTQEGSNLVARSEEDSILSPDLSEHGTEQTDSIISPEQDSNMRSSVDSIMSGQRADRSSNGLKYASHLFLTSGN